MFNDHYCYLTVNLTIAYTYTIISPFPMSMEQFNRCFPCKYNDCNSHNWWVLPAFATHYSALVAYSKASFTSLLECIKPCKVW